MRAVLIVLGQSEALAQTAQTFMHGYMWNLLPFLIFQDFREHHSMHLIIIKMKFNGRDQVPLIVNAVECIHQISLPRLSVKVGSFLLKADEKTSILQRINILQHFNRF